MANGRLLRLDEAGPHSNLIWRRWWWRVRGPIAVGVTTAVLLGLAARVELRGNAFVIGLAASLLASLFVRVVGLAWRNAASRTRH